MNSKTKRETLLPLADYTPDPGHRKSTHLDVEVYYDKGGPSAFSGASRPRGFYMSAGPISIEPCESGGEMRGFGLFSATAVFVESAGRLNPKRLDALAAEHFAALATKSGPLWALVQKVLTKADLRLAEGDPS